MDGNLRQKLGVRQGQWHDFTLESCSIFDEFLWLWQASDPAFRIAGRLGLISLFLGVVSLIIAVPPLFDLFGDKAKPMYVCVVPAGASGGLAHCTERPR
jgi:hypothetical protein